MQRLWSFRDGDPEYTFSIGHYSGTHQAARHARAVYEAAPDHHSCREPRVGDRSRRAYGLPAFLGIFGADLREQTRIYRTALAEANHPPEVVERCLRMVLDRLVEPLRRRHR